MWTIEIDLIMLLVGSFAGFMAGLLGIGGGMIIVPVVLWVLKMQGMADLEYAQHIAVGTSFAVMVFTMFSSMIAQHRRNMVDWKVVKQMAPAMVIGVFAGSYIAKYLSNHGLQIFFVVFAVLVAVKTLMDMKPKPSRSLPGPLGLNLVGAGFGVISSWVGIGGGSLSVPFMLYCNVPVRKAVAISAAQGWFIALAGAAGYLVSGWSAEGLPAGTLGFWYLPVAGILATATIIFAPLGVKVSHKLPPKKLQMAFGILLLAIAARMLWDIAVV